MRTVNTKTQAKNIAKEASDHKAKDIVVMDLRHVASFADYFVICSGGSERHVQAIADAVAFDQKKRGKKLLGEEGRSNARWILLDYGDVIMHIFYDEERRHYNLENLWHDAKRVMFKGITS